MIDAIRQCVLCDNCGAHILWHYAITKGRCWGCRAQLHGQILHGRQCKQVRQ